MQIFADGSPAEYTPIGEWVRETSVYNMMKQLAFFRNYMSQVCGQAGARSAARSWAGWAGGRKRATHCTNSSQKRCVPNQLVA